MPRFFRLFFLCAAMALLSSCGGRGADADAPNTSTTQLLAATTYVEPQTGWYWNPVEAGRGYAIERQGNQLFIAAFLYETTGEATWYVSSLTAQADGHYSGELTRYSGGQTLLGSYKSATAAKTADITISFTTATAGVINVVPVAGSQTSISIQRFPFSTPTAFAASQGAFESGWWWNSDEGGRGYFIEMQGSQAFIGSFMYGDSGQPTWYVSSADLQGPIGVSGPLDQYTGGQSLLASFKAAAKSNVSAGTMSFQLTSGNTGKMTLPNGTVVPLSRFTFNPVAPVGATSNLMISEVSTAYYGNDVAWVEVYNPNSVAVPLSDYSLRAPTINLKTLNATAAQTTFTLPRVNVPAKGYLVVGGKVSTPITSNSQMVLINSGDSVPFWQSSGAVELVKASQTADFVRFGSSSTAPLTASAWSGANVSALPSAAAEHGKSIVRLAAGGMADTNKATDWAQVNFATPAGPNDIASGVIDSDGDGVPDSAKIQGNTYAGMDLYAMGARPGQRDVFMQIDHVKNSDPATLPRKEALQKLVDTFAAKNLSPQKNIAIHLDAGDLYSASFSTASFNLGGGKEVISSKCTQLLATPDAGCNSLFDYRTAYFDVRRKLLFHYVLFSTSQLASGGCGSSGISHLGGNIIEITVGGCGLSTNAGSSLNLLVNAQASTLMHELGHNFGLQHGGNEKNNYKPNYYSIMNYLYQQPGLSSAPNGTHAADRYYLGTASHPKHSSVTMCSLDNTPCGTNYIMDYSDGSSIDLNELGLDESKNIGRGAVGGAYADWDKNSALTPGATVFVDIHQSETSSSLRVLKDYNDWAHLVLPFAQNPDFSTGFLGTSVFPKRSDLRKNPMNDQAFTTIRDDPLPAKFLEAVSYARKLPPSRLP